MWKTQISTENRILHLKFYILCEGYQIYPHVSHVAPIAKIQTLKGSHVTSQKAMIRCGDPQKGNAKISCLLAVCDPHNKKSVTNSPRNQKRPETQFLEASRRRRGLRVGSAHTHLDPTCPLRSWMFSVPEVWLAGQITAWLVGHPGTVDFPPHAVASCFTSLAAFNFVGLSIGSRKYQTLFVTAVQKLTKAQSWVLYLLSLQFELLQVVSFFNVLSASCSCYNKVPFTTLKLASDLTES